MFGIRHPIPVFDPQRSAQRLRHSFEIPGPGIIGHLDIDLACRLLVCAEAGIARLSEQIDVHIVYIPIGIGVLGGNKFDQSIQSRHLKAPLKVLVLETGRQSALCGPAGGRTERTWWWRDNAEPRSTWPSTSSTMACSSRVPSAAKISRASPNNCRAATESPVRQRSPARVVNALAKSLRAPMASKMRIACWTYSSAAPGSSRPRHSLISQHAHPSI